MHDRSRRWLALAVWVAGVLVAVGLTPAVGAPPVRPDLRVDVNRDGRADVSGQADTAGEDTWTASRGAILLPNIDDDAKRCPVRDARGKPLPDARLAACNDAADSVVNGARDARDLARLRTVPRPGTPAGATGTVRAAGAGASKTRLFVKRSGRWSLLKPTDRLSRGELRSGVEMGIEAKDVVRNAAVWNGRVTVRLTVAQGGTSASDDVTMRVAPVLTQNNLQRVREVLVDRVPGGDSFAKAQHRFVAGLARQVRAAGIRGPLKELTEYDEIWAQDFVEPGYASMPGPGGKPRTVRVLIRSAQPARTAGRALFEQLRGPDVGVVQVRGVRDSADDVWTLNSMGNLETIPPYRHAGRTFPAGRIIMGYRPDSGAKPAKAMRTFLSAQGMQSPLLLDTSWLFVGHVDEFIQFLPGRTARGWRIGVADPGAGIELLRRAERDGLGRTRMFSRLGAHRAPASKKTIGQVLASKAFLDDNKLAAERIRANLEIIKRETGITDSRITRVPQLFTRTSGDGGGTSNSRKLRRMGPGQKHARKAGHQAPRRTKQTSAYVPGAVNGVVLSRTRYLAPQQWGPVIDGKDVFTRAVSSAYRKAGFTVEYLDDWYVYHLNTGEVHCATNTLRDTSAPWWGAD